MVKRNEATSRRLGRLNGLLEETVKIGGGGCGKLGLAYPKHLSTSFGGERGIGRLIASATIGHRGQIGAVGFHQDPVQRRMGENLAQFARFRKGRDALH